MRTLLYVLIFFIATSSSILSLLLMLEPSGRLTSWNLSALTSSNFDTFKIPGLIMFLTIGLPGLFCLFMMAINHRLQYVFALSLSLIILALSVYILQSLKTALWIPASFIILAFFMALISYQLRGKKIL